MKVQKNNLFLLLIIGTVIVVTIIAFGIRVYNNKANVIPENSDIELIGGIPDETDDIPKPKILSKEKVIGYFVNTEWGDYRHLNIKDMNGNELSFFISTDINMDTLTELEENSELDKKKIELTWYKVAIYIPESGGVNELEVAMHIKILK